MSYSLKDNALHRFPVIREALGDSRGMTVKEIGARTGIAYQNLNRTLGTLRSLGLVEEHFVPSISLTRLTYWRLR